MKLGELKRGDVERVAPEVSQGVRILWSNGYWDGPLDGVAECQGARMLFTIFDDFVEDDPPRKKRRFWLVELTTDQLADEEYWHRLFQEHVGTHMDYGADGGRQGSMALSANPRAFYDAYEKRPKVDYSGNEVLGWFEW